MAIQAPKSPVNTANNILQYFVIKKILPQYNIISHHVNEQSIIKTVFHSRLVPKTKPTELTSASVVLFVVIVIVALGSCQLAGLYEKILPCARLRRCIAQLVALLLALQTSPRRRAFHEYTSTRLCRLHDPAQRRQQTVHQRELFRYGKKRFLILFFIDLFYLFIFIS